MGVRGVKPKPTVLKLVKGTQKPSRVKPEPVAVRKGLPKPPKHLSALASQEWEDMVQDLYDCGILSTTDRTVLAGYCEAYANWVESSLARQAASARDRTGNYGLLEITSNGNVILSPLVGANNRCLEIVLRFCVEMGMTPSARSRVTPTGNEKPNEDHEASFLQGVG